MAIATTPDLLRSRLEKYAAAGVDEIALDLSSPPEQRSEAMAALVAARPE